jgi:hypothetical protein
MYRVVDGWLFAKAAMLWLGRIGYPQGIDRASAKALGIDIGGVYTCPVGEETGLAFFSIASSDKFVCCPAGVADAQRLGSVLVRSDGQAQYPVRDAEIPQHARGYAAGGNAYAEGSYGILGAFWLLPVADEPQWTAAAMEYPQGA